MILFSEYLSLYSREISPSSNLLSFNIVSASFSVLPDKSGVSKYLLPNIPIAIKPNKPNNKRIITIA